MHPFLSMIVIIFSIMSVISTTRALVITGGDVALSDTNYNTESVTIQDALSIVISKCTFTQPLLIHSTSSGVMMMSKEIKITDSQFLSSTASLTITNIKTTQRIYLYHVIFNESSTGAKFSHLDFNKQEECSGTSTAHLYFHFVSFDLGSKISVEDSKFQMPASAACTAAGTSIFFVGCKMLSSGGEMQFSRNTIENGKDGISFDSTTKISDGKIILIDSEILVSDLALTALSPLEKSKVLLDNNVVSQNVYVSLGDASQLISSSASSSWGSVANNVEILVQYPSSRINLAENISPLINTKIGGTLTLENFVLFPTSASSAVVLLEDVKDGWDALHFRNLQMNATTLILRDMNLTNLLFESCVFNEEAVLKIEKSYFSSARRKNPNHCKNLLSFSRGSFFRGGATFSIEESETDLHPINCESSSTFLITETTLQEKSKFLFYQNIFRGRSYAFYFVARNSRFENSSLELVGNQLLDAENSLVLMPTLNAGSILRIENNTMTGLVVIRMSKSSVFIPPPSSSSVGWGIFSADIQIFNVLESGAEERDAMELKYAIPPCGTTILGELQISGFKLSETLVVEDCKWKGALYLFTVSLHPNSNLTFSNITTARVYILALSVQNATLTFQNSQILAGTTCRETFVLSSATFENSRFIISNNNMSLHCVHPTVVFHVSTSTFKNSHQLYRHNHFDGRVYGIYHNHGVAEGGSVTLVDNTVISTKISGIYFVNALVDMQLHVENNHIEMGSFVFQGLERCVVAPVASWGTMAGSVEIYVKEMQLTDAIVPISTFVGGLVRLVGFQVDNRVYHRSAPNWRTLLLDGLIMSKNALFEISDIHDGNSVEMLRTKLTDSEARFTNITANNIYFHSCSMWNSTLAVQNSVFFKSSTPCVTPITLASSIFQNNSRWIVTGNSLKLPCRNPTVVLHVSATTFLENCHQVYHNNTMQGVIYGIYYSNSEMKGGGTWALTNNRIEGTEYDAVGQLNPMWGVVLHIENNDFESSVELRGLRRCQFVSVYSWGRVGKEVSIYGVEMALSENIIPVATTVGGAVKLSGFSLLNGQYILNGAIHWGRVVFHSLNVTNSQILLFGLETSQLEVEASIFSSNSTFALVNSTIVTVSACHNTVAFQSSIFLDSAIFIQHSTLQRTLAYEGSLCVTICNVYFVSTTLINSRQCYTNNTFIGWFHFRYQSGQVFGGKLSFIGNQLQGTSQGFSFRNLFSLEQVVVQWIENNVTGKVELYMRNSSFASPSSPSSSSLSPSWGTFWNEVTLVGQDMSLAENFPPFQTEFHGGLLLSKFSMNNETLIITSPSSPSLLLNRPLYKKIALRSMTFLSSSIAFVGIRATSIALHDLHFEAASNLSFVRCVINHVDSQEPSGNCLFSQFTMALSNFKGNSTLQFSENELFVAQRCQTTLGIYFERTKMGSAGGQFFFTKNKILCQRNCIQLGANSNFENVDLLLTKNNITSQNAKDSALSVKVIDFPRGSFVEPKLMISENFFYGDVFIGVRGGTIIQHGDNEFSGEEIFPPGWGLIDGDLTFWGGNQELTGQEEIVPAATIVTGTVQLVDFIVRDQTKIILSNFVSWSQIKIVNFIIENSSFTFQNVVANGTSFVRTSLIGNHSFLHFYNLSLKVPNGTKVASCHSPFEMNNPSIDDGGMISFTRCSFDLQAACSTKHVFLFFSPKFAKSAEICFTENNFTNLRQDLGLLMSGGSFSFGGSLYFRQNQFLGCNLNIATPLTDVSVFLAQNKIDKGVLFTKLQNLEVSSYTTSLAIFENIFGEEVIVGKDVAEAKMAFIVKNHFGGVEGMAPPKLGSILSTPPSTWVVAGNTWKDSVAALTSSASPSYSSEAARFQFLSPSASNVLLSFLKDPENTVLKSACSGLISGGSCLPFAPHNTCPTATLYTNSEGVPSSFSAHLQLFSHFREYDASLSENGKQLAKKAAEAILLQAATTNWCPVFIAPPVTTFPAPTTAAASTTAPPVSTAIQNTSHVTQTLTQHEGQTTTPTRKELLVQHSSTRTPDCISESISQKRNDNEKGREEKVTATKSFSFSPENNNTKNMTTADVGDGSTTGGPADDSNHNGPMKSSNSLNDASIEVLIEILPETSAKVLSATTGSTVLIASAVVLPSIGPLASRMSSLLRVASCHFIEADIESIPSPVEQPFGFAALHQGTLAHYSTALLINFALFGVILALQRGFLFSSLTVAKKGYGLCGVLAMALVAYQWGSNLQNAVMILSLWHLATSFDRVVSLVIILGQLLFFFGATRLLISNFRAEIVEKTTVAVGKSEKNEKSHQKKNIRNRKTVREFQDIVSPLDEGRGGDFVFRYGILFDGLRSARLSVRLYYLIELVVAMVLGLLAGARPSSQEHCFIMAVMMTIISFLYFLYIILVRPLVSKLEMSCVIVFGLLQLILAIAAVVSLNEKYPAIKVVAVCEMVLSASFILGSVAMLFWRYVVTARRRVREREAENAVEELEMVNVSLTTSSSHQQEQEVPLLSKIPRRDSEADQSPSKRPHCENGENVELTEMKKLLPTAINVNPLNTVKQ